MWTVAHRNWGWVLRRPALTILTCPVQVRDTRLRAECWSLARAASCCPALWLRSGGGVGALQPALLGVYTREEDEVGPERPVYKQ